MNRLLGSADTLSFLPAMQDTACSKGVGEIAPQSNEPGERLQLEKKLAGGGSFDSVYDKIKVVLCFSLVLSPIYFQLQVLVTEVH
jgi:hypothetical protein